MPNPFKINTQEKDIMAGQAQQEKYKLVIIYHEKPAETVLSKLRHNHPNLDIVFYYGQSVATDVPDRKPRFRPRIVSF
jgi:hypothetical protein